MLRNHGSLLNRAIAEIGHVHTLRGVKRRRLSMNVFQQSKDALRSPYFFTKTQWQTLQTIPAAPSSVTQRHDGAGAFKTPPLSSCSRIDVSLYKPNPPLTFPRLMRIYGQLSKSRLTFLMVLTAMSGVALSPLSTTVPVLLSTALGTTLCSASANTLNQLSEHPFDAQMARTRARPLVRGAISSAHAASFALVTGIAGPTILLAFANPISAFLGAANIGLYASVYTRLKRHSVANTWVGAVVGGIPPLIGWTACGGQIFPSTTCPVEIFLPPCLFDFATAVPMDYVGNPLEALVLFCLLFSWQFPHFNSLSYIVRDAYAQGGYKMLSVTNPSLNSLVSLRHAAALLAITSIMTPLSGLTTWTFAMTSLVPNAFILRSAWRFWREGSEKEAKALWNISLWYLPVILGLMMFHKHGIEWTSFAWDRSHKKTVDPSTT